MSRASQRSADDGLFGIGVWRPMKSINVGTLLRTAHNYGANFTFVVGEPKDGQHFARQHGNTTKSHLRVPHLVFSDLDDLRTHLPLGAKLVAVELAHDAVALRAFGHPKVAVYLLGAEDHGLPSEVVEGCDSVVEIEGSRWSLNVAVAGSIVIYDRHRKSVSTHQPIP